MSASTIIDIFCHIFPERYFQEMTAAAPNLENMGKRLKQVTKLFDLDARFREMDQFGDYREIISLPNPPIEDIADGKLGLTLARIANDSMAELCRKHPERFPTFVAAVSLKDVEGSVAEARRAIKDLGACGIQVYTPNAGRPLDDPVFEPMFATMAELDLPIWLHPARGANLTDYPAEAKSRYEMWWCFGWPYDTSVAMVRLVFGGLFDRYPKLKIITHHLGGMIPYLRRPRRTRPGGARRAHLGRGLFQGAAVAEAAAPRLPAGFLRRHRDVRRRHACAALRARVLRRRSRGVRDRHAARADRADHRGGQAARPAGGRYAKTVRRKRRTAAQSQIQLTQYDRTD